MEILTVGSSRAVELSAATLPYSSGYVIAFPVSKTGGTGGPLPLPNAPGSCCGELRGGSETRGKIYHFTFYKCSIKCN